MDSYEAVCIDQFSHFCSFNWFPIPEHCSYSAMTTESSSLKYCALAILFFSHRLENKRWKLQCLTLDFLSYRTKTDVQILIAVINVSILRSLRLLHWGFADRLDSSSCIECNFVFCLPKPQISILLPCYQDFQYRFANENGGYAPVRPRQHQAGGELSIQVRFSHPCVF